MYMYIYIFNYEDCSNQDFKLGYARFRVAY